MPPNPDSLPCSGLIPLGPSRNTATRVKESASNGGVKPVSQNCKMLVWITLAMGSIVVFSTCAALAQTAADSSAIVSPKSATHAAPAIQPRKPSIAEDGEEASISVDPSSLLPDLPPVPRENATLMGGTIERLDHVRDRVTVKLFGGGKETVLFDPRTQVYRGGKPATLADLREGERVYLDTILDGSTVFARALRLDGSRAWGQSQGVILKSRSDRGELTFRDALAPNPVQVHVTSTTKVTQDEQASNLNSLVPGALISVNFSSDGNRNTANEISILAHPGTRYEFAGNVTYIDLRSGLLVLTSSTNHKTYEVYLAPSAIPADNLHAGANVSAIADFDGSRYVVRTLTVNPQ